MTDVLRKFQQMTTTSELKSMADYGGSKMQSGITHIMFDTSLLSGDMLTAWNRMVGGEGKKYLHLYSPIDITPDTILEPDELLGSIWADSSIGASKYSEPVEGHPGWKPGTRIQIKDYVGTTKTAPAHRDFHQITFIMLPPTQPLKLVYFNNVPSDWNQYQYIHLYSSQIFTVGDIISADDLVGSGWTNGSIGQNRYSRPVANHASANWKPPYDIKITGYNGFAPKTNEDYEEFHSFNIEAVRPESQSDTDADNGAGSNGDNGAGSNGDNGAGSNGDNGAGSNGDNGAGSNGDNGAGSNGDNDAESNGDIMSTLTENKEMVGVAVAAIAIIAVLAMKK